MNVVKTMTSLLAAAALSQAAHAQLDSGFSVSAEAAYEDFRNDRNDVTYGVGVGYDYRIGDRWLIGGGVRAIVEGVDESEESVTPQMRARTRVEHDDQWIFSARVGWLVVDRLLAFAQVEYDRFDIETTRTETAPVCAPPGGCVNTVKQRTDDHVWGGAVGLEYAATSNLRIRASYGYGEHGSQERSRVGVALAWKF